MNVDTYSRQKKRSKERRKKGKKRLNEAKKEKENKDFLRDSWALSGKTWSSISGFSNFVLFKNITIYLF